MTFNHKAIYHENIIGILIGQNAMTRIIVHTMKNRSNAPFQQETGVRPSDILVVTQLRSCDDLFWRLQYYCPVTHTTNFTIIIITSQINQHISELDDNKDVNSFANYIYC